MWKQVCFVAATLAFPCAIMAQSSTPPVKMGLWQTTNTSKISGFQIPPDVAARLQAMGRPLPMGEPHTTVMRSCFTPEGWKNLFRDMQRNKDCTFTNMRQDSAGLSTDVVCKSGESSSKSHIDVTFVSSEKIHGKAHGEMITQRESQPIVFDASFDSLYKGADCKGVSPDHAEVVR